MLAAGAGPVVGAALAAAPGGITGALAAVGAGSGDPVVGVVSTMGLVADAAGAALSDGAAVAGGAVAASGGGADAFSQPASEITNTVPSTTHRGIDMAAKSRSASTGKERFSQSRWERRRRSISESRVTTPLATI